MTARSARTPAWIDGISEADFREACEHHFFIKADLLLDKARRCGFERKYKAARAEEDRLLAQLKEKSGAPWPERDRLYARLERVSERVDALQCVLWPRPKPAPESAKPSPTPKEDR